MRRSKRAAVAFVVSSDDEWNTSDSGTSSPNLPRLRNTRTNRIPTTSSSSSSSSDSPIPRPRRAASRTISAVSETTSDSSSEDEQVVVEGDENDWEDVESEEEIKATKKTKPVLPALASSSDSDDPSAEPCPICLRKLTTQEIGTPESCDHSFCLTCLQQWAKNVNTCPVDRQHFSMILVRKCGSDEILRSIRVENVEVVEVVDVVDDPTACEICGESDREDRLMLCDGCNRGYHLECMTPPLDHVPIEEWYCPDCNDDFIIPNEDSFSDEEWSINIRRTRRGGVGGIVLRQSRLMPRTRQSERIMSLLGHPTSTNASRHMSQASGSQRRMGAGAGGRAAAVRSNQASATPRRATRAGRKKRRKRKTNAAFRIKVIQTEEGTIEVSLPRKKRKKRRVKRRRTGGGGGPRVAGTVAKTPKERLAKRLGICARKHVASKQTPPTLSGTQQLSMSRASAGIPTLDLFGNRNQLDDLISGSESEDFEFGGGGGGGGGGVSVGIASRHRVTSTMSRRKAKAGLVMSRGRPAASTPATATAPAPAHGSLLDSILEDQAKWHSRNSEIIHNVSDGSLTVKVHDKDKAVASVAGGDKIDVKKATAKVSETPLYPGSNNPRYSNYNYQQSGNASNNTRSVDNSPAGSSSSAMNRSFPTSFPQSRSEFSSNYGIGISPFTGSAPIRFRMTAPPRKPTMIIPPLEQPPMPDASLFPSLHSPSHSSNDDEEVDIYSDIEPERSNGGEADDSDRNFGTLEPPPEPPAILMNIGTDDNAASDDEGLIIDDRPPPPLPPPLPAPDTMYDPAEPCDSNSSTDEAGPSKIPYPPLPKRWKGPPAPPEPDDPASHPNYGMCPTIGLVPSDSSEEEAAECPNFSMYSSTSMTLVAQKDEDAADEDSESPITASSDNLPDIPLPAYEPHLPKPNAGDEASEEDGQIDDDDDDEEVEENDDTESSNVEKIVGDDIENQLNDLELKSFNQNTMDIPIPADMKEEDIPIPAELNNEEIPIPEKTEETDENKEASLGDEEKSCSQHEEKSEADENGESEKASVQSRECEDEGSTQDVLDLAIESEANLQDAHDENDDATSISTVGKETAESKEKQIDAGEKPDGLIDITDEEMSVYDGQDDNLDKGASEAAESKDGAENVEHDVLESDDDNSLIGGATSAVSGGTLNNSDNPQVSSLPGLEGLETETISESEDVNFDEIPEGVPQSASNEDEYSSSKKKKKKKSKKSNCISETDESVLLGLKGQLMDMLEFEEGEIIEDKPKQSSKKDKKAKSKHDKDVPEKEKEHTSSAARKSKTPPLDKDSEKKQKKKKDKKDSGKDKSGESSKGKDSKFKEKTAKVGEGDENVSWKKLSKSTKERNYRDGKEKDERSKAPAQEPTKKEKEKEKKKEKRKELERYDVRRLISERPKRPKKDEFGRDISPSPSESLSPPRQRNRSPLRVRNRSRSPWRSRSRSRARRRTRTPPRRQRSRERRLRTLSRERAPKRDRSRSRVRARPKSRERERERPPPPAKTAKKKPRNDSRSKKKSKSRSPVRPAKRISRSLSKSWSPSWSRSSASRSRSVTPHNQQSCSISRSVSRSWSRGRDAHKNPHKNLTVIVTNKDAMRKKDKKKTTRKGKDDKQRKRKRGQSPAPSKEVFTSGDNILVSVNFKSNRGAAELVPATTPVLRESSKRKRDDVDPITGRKKKDKNSKENVPARSKKSQLSKSTRLLRLNETVKNAKPVAVIDLDMSPFREQTPSPKEVIILTDSGGEDNDKQHNDLEKQLERMGEGHEPGRRDQQPESPSTHSFMMTSTGPKTPPEPHIKFSIVSNKPQLRTLNNPLMECDDEMRQDEAADEEEMMHKGPNTPPEPPPELNTPASPPTTPYDPFDPTKSRSPSPQPLNDSKQDKTAADNLNASLQSDIEEHAARLLEHRTLTPPMDADELKKTPEPLKSLSTPKPEQSTEPSPKHQSPSTAGDQSKIADDNLLKPFQKLLSSQSKVDISVHKSPDKGMTTVIISQQGQQIKSTSLLPTKQITSTTSKTLQITTSKILSKPTPAPYNPLQALNANKAARAQQNGNDATDDILELDVGSPYSPGSSEGDDLFDPPAMTPPRTAVPAKRGKLAQNKLDVLFGAPPTKSSRRGKHSSKAAKKASKAKTTKGTGKKEVNVKLDEDQLKILDDLPSSAVEMQFLKKLNRQERVVEEVKMVLKPHYAKKHIGKEEYKEILRRAVPKICHNRSGEINPMKIQFLVEAYVRKFRKNTGAERSGAGSGGVAKKKGGGTGAGAGGGGGSSSATGGGGGGVPLSISIPPKPKMQKTLWS